MTLGWTWIVRTCCLGTRRVVTRMFLGWMLISYLEKRTTQWRKKGGRRQWLKI